MRGTAQKTLAPAAIMTEIYVNTFANHGRLYVYKLLLVMGSQILSQIKGDWINKPCSIAQGQPQVNFTLPLDWVGEILISQPHSYILQCLRNLKTSLPV